jgi:hypothetical protein
MASLRRIKVGLGITAQIGTQYIKPSAEVELVLTGDETKEEIDKVWEQGWNACSREVERVIMEYAKD